jgi:hypothetical protein
MNQAWRQQQVLRWNTMMEDPLANEPNPKIKVALLTAARRQAELDDALADLEDVLKEVAPNHPLTSDVFTLNEKIDQILIALADKYNVEIPDPHPQNERAP